MSAAYALLRRISGELTLPSELLHDVEAPSSAVPLPSRLSTGDLAWASTAAAALIGGRDVRQLDPSRISLSYRSDRFFTVDGRAPEFWSPLSGFWRTADGWIRTHGNYPHHAAGLRTALALGSAADERVVSRAMEGRPSIEVVSAIVEAGGLAVVVNPEDALADERLRATPLLETRRIADTLPSIAMRQFDSRAPLAGIRILDLTRVIAGPVCTRTLALLGAEVLRIDPPRLPEPAWQHLDTGHAKRSAVLDARSAQLHDLLHAADAVVVGYRPAALTRLGLSPEALAERHPHLVIAQLSAWGADVPQRAGFDSLVQAECGIALVESVDGETPGALPAQALDHSAGYLLAAAVTALLTRHEAGRGGMLVRTSLRRIAAELLGMPRHAQPEPMPSIDPSPHLARFMVDGSVLTTVRPVFPGMEFEAPRPWGADQPRW